MEEAVSRFYGTSPASPYRHKAGDVYVDWKAAKDGKLNPPHWETFTDPKLKAEFLKRDEHRELGIDGRLR